MMGGLKLVRHEEAEPIERDAPSTTHAAPAGNCPPRIAPTAPARMQLLDRTHNRRRTMALRPSIFHPPPLLNRLYPQPTNEPLTDCGRNDANTHQQLESL